MWLSTGPIFTLLLLPLFKELVWGKHLIQDCDRPQETRHIASVIQCEVYFNILNHVVMTHECDIDTDRQTNFATAKAVPHYVVWPNTVCCFGALSIVAEQQMHCQ